MSKATIYTCDIENCTIQLKEWNNKSYPVVFVTEQTEGRATEKPYISWDAIDLCDAHMQQLINTLPIVASGAMGHNKYNFRKSS